MTELSKHFVLPALTLALLGMHSAYRITSQKIQV